MDFRQAFDKGPYGRLIQKAKSYGFEGVLPNWIQNWLGGKGSSDGRGGLLFRLEACA